MFVCVCVCVCTVCVGTCLFVFKDNIMGGAWAGGSGGCVCLGNGGVG